MMKKLLGLLPLVSCAALAPAHPGVGIVQDNHGNVFFTDTKQVWKIAPDGKQLLAVADVHTHELSLDAKDNLYGEHLWYEGDATKKWGHRVWCLKSDGTISDVIPAREGFLKEYSFVRDREGNMYWVDRAKATVIKKRSPDGKVATHAAGDFRAVQWMAARPDGTLFLVDAGDLRRISVDGKVFTVAAKLSSHKPPPAKVADLNYHMGLWTDAEGCVYVAVTAERLVLKMDSDGSGKVVARSSDPWAPSGGMFDRDGDLWLLEYDSANAVRARRIGRDARERIFTNQK